MWGGSESCEGERWQTPVPRCRRERQRKEGGGASPQLGAQGMQHRMQF